RLIDAVASGALHSHDAVNPLRPAGESSMSSDDTSSPAAADLVLDRRAFLRHSTAGAAAAAALAAGLTIPVSEASAGVPEEGQDSPMSSLARRGTSAEKYRDRMARVAMHRNRPMTVLANNGEEADYPFVANYSKAMPHNALGEVDPTAYAALLHAVTTG